MKSKLKDVNPENNFWASDGRSIKNLFELADVLESMSHETFSSHVNEHKNDFSAWLNDVVGAKELAVKMGEIKDKTQSHVSVLKYIVNQVR